MGQGESGLPARLARHPPAPFRPEERHAGAGGPDREGPGAVQAGVIEFRQDKNGALRKARLSSAYCDLRRGADLESLPCFRPFVILRYG